MAVTHKLKCWPTFFEAIERGDKRFDVRRDDRGFQKGDSVELMKYDPQKARYVQSQWSSDPVTVTKKIRYVLTGGQFGIEPGYVVLGF